MEFLARLLDPGYHGLFALVEEGMSLAPEGDLCPPSIGVRVNTFDTRLGSGGAPPAFICHVVLVSTQLKVIRIDTSWIVALVPHMELFREVAFVDAEGCPVGGAGRAVVPEAAVTGWARGGSLVNPTGCAESGMWYRIDCDLFHQPSFGLLVVFLFGEFGHGGASFLWLCVWLILSSNRFGIGGGWI